MATQKNFLDDDENQQDQGQTTNLESTAAGGGASPSSGSANQPAAAQQGTGWTNLQQYLTANQGQGGGVANAVTKDAQTQVDSAESNAKAWETAAKTRTDDATKKNQFGEQIKTGDPTKIDQSAYSAWKNLGNYWGKNSAAEDQGYGDAYNQTQQAKQNVSGAQDYDTQKTLANKTFNTQGRYTPGMSTLDTFIMRGDDSGKQALQQFQDKNKNVGQGFDASVGNVNSYIGGAANRGKGNYDATMQAIKDRAAGIQGTAEKSKTGIYDKAFNQANQDIGKRYESQGMKTPGNYNDFISANGDFSWQDALSDPDLAALNSLSGMDDDTNTNAITKRNNAPVNVNWDDINKSIESMRAPPVTSTTTPQTSKSVEGGTHDYSRTDNSDGTYTVNDHGAIVTYNADGSVKGIDDSKADNKFS